MIWYTADLHLGHTNIIRHCGRPFANAEEMDGVILDNLNSVLRPTDRLIILGDFCGRRVRESVLDHYVQRIRLHRNNMVLVLGNHDNERECRKVFPSVCGLTEVNDNGTKIVCCHYAMRRWNQSHRGRWHLYGHSHGRLPGEGLSMDVGVDCWSFRPINLQTVREVMESRVRDMPDVLTVETSVQQLQAGQYVTSREWMDELGGLPSQLPDTKTQEL